MRNEVGGYHDNSQQGCLFGLRYFVLDVLLVFISLWDWKMLSLKMRLELIELPAQKHFPSAVELGKFSPCGSWVLVFAKFSLSSSV